MKPVIIGLLLIGLASGPGSVSAAPAPATPAAETPTVKPPAPPAKGSAAKELSDAQSAIGDLTSEFTLTISGAAMDGQDLQAQGKVWLASGRRYRVQYYQPERQLLVSDGSKRWLYLEKINQVQIQALPPSGDANEFFLELGGGLPALVARSHVRRIASPKTKDRVYALTPKPDSGLQFQKATIWLAADTLLPRRVVVEAGRRVEARFHNLQAHFHRNLLKQPEAGLAADLFTFTPPEGAEVIEMLWPGM